MKVIRDINLSFEYPPIPDRRWDWSATRSGYEPGELIGRGPTPEKALADLLEQEAEREEPDQAHEELMGVVKEVLGVPSR